MSELDATNLVTPPPPETGPAAVVGGFRPPGPAFTDWIAQAEYLASTPPGLGMPGDLIGNPHAIVMRMQFAEALNIPFMIAVQDLYVVDNRVGMRAELIRALMHRAGHQFSFPRHDDKICVMRLRRADQPDREEQVIWTLEEAEQAGLLSNAKTADYWRAYTEDCLIAAATRRMGRRHTPELTKGFAYGHDELALASATAPFATSAADLAAQVAELVDEARHAATVQDLRRTCEDAKARSLLDQVTDEGGPACGESLRVYLLDRWDHLTDRTRTTTAGDSGDGDTADTEGRPVAESAPPQRQATATTADRYSGDPGQWRHPDCGACKTVAVLVNGDHDPGCDHRKTRTRTQGASA